MARVAQYTTRTGVGRVRIVLIKIVTEVAPDMTRRRILWRPIARIEMGDTNTVTGGSAAHLLEASEAGCQMPSGAHQCRGRPILVKSLLRRRRRSCRRCWCLLQQVRLDINRILGSASHPVCHVPR